VQQHPGDPKIHAPWLQQHVQLELPIEDWREEIQLCRGIMPQFPMSLADLLIPDYCCFKNVVGGTLAWEVERPGG
jgi:hypothetical protein